MESLEGLDTTEVLLMCEYDQSWAPHDSTPFSISAISFSDFLYCLFPFCFFHKLSESQSTRVKPSPAEGRFPGQEDADEGEFPGYATSSKAPPLDLP